MSGKVIYRTSRVYDLSEKKGVNLMVTPSCGKYMLHFSAQHEARIDVTAEQLRTWVLEMVEHLKRGDDLGDLPVRLLESMGVKFEVPRG